MSTKQYLGDSVYIDFDGYGLTLTTENGAGPSNTVYLEPDIYHALVAYVDTLKNVPRKNFSGAECDVASAECWIDDETGEHINATTGERTPNHVQVRL